MKVRQRERSITDGVGEMADSDVETCGSIFCVGVVYQRGSEAIVEAYDPVVPLIEVGLLDGL